MFVKGCDVSKYQGLVDWNHMKLLGYNWAYAKATEGISFVDSQFHRNQIAIPQSGMLGGAYLFFKPGQDPLQQAKHFCDVVGKDSPLKLPPMLDWEVSDGVRVSTQIQHAQIILDYLEQFFGKTPILYSYLSYLSQLNLPESFTKYPLWLAEYKWAPGVVPTQMPQAPRPWTVVTMLQYAADHGLDKDLFNGPMSQLEKFAI